MKLLYALLFMLGPRIYTLGVFPEQSQIVEVIDLMVHYKDHSGCCSFHVTWLDDHHPGNDVAHESQPGYSLEYGEGPHDQMPKVLQLRWIHGSAE